MTKKVTIGVIVGLILLITGWDIYVASNDIKGDTISEIFLSWAETSHLFPLGMGILIGHLFWPQYKSLKDEEK